MIIGYQAVGKRNFYTNPDTGFSEDLFVTNGIALNKYTATGTLYGECTASVYARLYSQSGTVCRPVLYTGVNNYPDTKVSVNEGYYDVSSPQNYKWRTAVFEIAGEIPADTEIWFGFYADSFNPCFDFGSKHVIAYLGEGVSGIPGVFPAGAWKNKNEIQFSTFFEVNPSQQYEITITQGVTLTDSRKHSANYQRAAAMNAKGTTLLGHGSNYYREHISAVSVTSVFSRFRGFFRSITGQVKTGDLVSYCRDLLRTIAVTVRPETEGKRSLSARRDVADYEGVEDSTARERGFIRTLVTAVSTGGYAGKVITLLRGIREEVSALGEAGHLGDYLRGLYTEAGVMAETTHEGEYYRAVEDTAGSMAVSLRHLFIFLRLVTLSLVRDYLLSRFLRSRDELVVKSPVTREIELDSAIH
jgi:hypothetical protein